VQVGRTEIVALAREVREGAVYCCIRAEEVTLQKGAAASTSARNQLPARIVSLTQEGALILVEFVKLWGSGTFQAFCHTASDRNRHIP